MVLLLADLQVPIGCQQLRTPGITLSTLSSFPGLAESVQNTVKAAGIKVATQLTAAGTISGTTLYVNQRECAFVHQTDPVVRALASDDATTCHLVALRHPSTGDAMLGHFDGTGAGSLVQLADKRFYDVTAAMAETVALSEAAAVVELHLVGGFADRRGESAQVTQALLMAFTESKHPYRLVTACVGSANTVLRGGQPHPAITGLTVAVVAGKHGPSEFLTPSTIPLEMRGPWQTLRNLRFLCHDEAVHEVYDPDRHCLVLQPFDYSRSRLPREFADAADHQLALLSTSPRQEPAHFVPCLRRSLKFARAFDRPDKQVFHRGCIVERPLANGVWQHVSGAEEKDLKV